MAIISARVTATTAATALAACAQFKIVEGAVKNAGARSVYLGSSSLAATTDGFELGAGQTFSFTLRNSETLYGISSSTDGTACHVLRMWDAT